MSSTWNEGYFTDVGYTYGYYREINPVFQRFCLLLRGFAPVESSNPVHCELGFGQGVSINIHAAANPGSYVGTDFNPAQAAHANSLAVSYDKNPRLYDDSFEQLLARNDLPQFDSISLHGIWTWVSRDHHKQIVEFVRRHLKPGGVLYNSYNCFPGWSPAAPLRQLFSLHDRFMPHSSDHSTRVEKALQFSESLLAANPIYAKSTPGLDDRLKKIMGQDRQYVAHEYFNREWNCMYFTDVVDALSPAKVEFAGSAVPFDTVDAINLSAEGQAFLSTIDNPIMREQTRDYFVNQQFRKDIYTKGASRISSAEQVSRLLETRFVLLKPIDEISSKVSTISGEATLQGDIYVPVMEALAAKNYAPKTLSQLLSSVPTHSYQVMLQTLTILVGVDAVAPCHSEESEKQVQSRCSLLNQHLCQQSAYESKISLLSSPLTGGGVVVERFQQLFLVALRQGKKQPAEWAQWAWQTLSVQGQRLLKEGKALETAEENIAELTLQATTFAERKLPILKALRVA